MIDITNMIEPESVPLCPLCDQPISQYEEIDIFSAHEMVGIGHKFCIEQEQGQ